MVYLACWDLNPSQKSSMFASRILSEIKKPPSLWVIPACINVFVDQTQWGHTIGVRNRVVQAAPSAPGQQLALQSVAGPAD